MKLSISQLALSPQIQDQYFAYLTTRGFSALEILPTMVVGDDPYSKKAQAKKFKNDLWDNYHLQISSMQSLLYGRAENLFGSDQERETLFLYLKEAIKFASEINCPNLVFGSPKNRIIGNRAKEKLSSSSLVVNFFKELGDFAFTHNTCLSIEPNPSIYGGDYIVTTPEAVDLVKKVDSKGFLVNFDLGTAIYNHEDLTILADNINLINHFHFSEPNLEPIRQRNLHFQLTQILEHAGYDRYVSLEMKDLHNLAQTKKIIDYLGFLFGAEF